MKGTYCPPKKANKKNTSRAAMIEKMAKKGK